MKKNMGNMDRTIRIIVTAVIALLCFTGQITGTAAIILGVIAVIFIVTSLISFCPLYAILGISTAKKG